MTEATLVISPHLDDAVLSCGRYLASHPGCTVVTVFAGLPDPAIRQVGLGWDELFENSTVAVLHRRGEDTHGLKRLQATPLHLNYLDGQYHTQRSPNFENGIHDDLSSIVRDYSTVLMPLGLLHPDHQLVSDISASLEMSATRVLYMDMPYGLFRYDAVVQRLHQLGMPNRWVAEVDEGSVQSKDDAVAHYRSQLPQVCRAFRVTDASNLYSHEEQYWVLT
jgi:LmbE family N-acetylglucosaminyl deacetylase